MVSPLEIEEKEFGSQISGYKKTEVDDFLYNIANDIEELLKEIEIKNKEILRLNDELDKFNRIEKNITEALVLAKETSNEIIVNAKNKADVIVKEGENKAKNIIDEANNDILGAKRELQDIKKDMKLYKVKMQSLIKSQLELNESIEVD